jgi:hypothetical protein
LEVGQWHNFLVGKSGVVVHNSYYDDFVKYIDNYAGSSLSSVQRSRLKEIFKDHDFLIAEWKAADNQLAQTLWVDKMAKIVDGPWYALHKEANSLFAAEVQNLKGLYPKAKIGYRGSLSRGQKFIEEDPITKKAIFGDFNPNSFDMDGFIVSDALAAKFPADKQVFKAWRDARKLKSEPIFENAADNLHLEFSKKLSGYRKDDIFTFRVWTEAEFEYEVVKNGYKLIK